MRALIVFLILGVVGSVGAMSASWASSELSPRPQPRVSEPQWTRWHDEPGHQVWEQAALLALRGHARALVEFVPRDIEAWCPAYRTASPAARRAFWVGFLSALAKHESTYRPDAVGGDGRWFGLLQISPATARAYGCVAETGAALQDGAANLSCALRIMAETVSRDGVVFGSDPRWLGVSADWGPLRVTSKRRDIASWTRQSPACEMATSLRPKARTNPLSQ